ncbi:MAG: RNA polymerase sigma factor SigZ [Anaerolineae bacterium]|nr:RNA polymerase sigma factor SigZ [Anaerolineae bacterium]
MEKQLESIWHEFSGNLRRFILKRVRDEQAADDILQEVFIKVHQHLGTLADETRLESWLYQITRNAIADHYRRQPAALDLDEDLVLAEDDEDDGLQVALAASLGRMIEGLPDEYRTALVMDSEGVPQAEIGARMGLSLSGAKSRVQRARAKLRDMLFDCCHFEFDRRGAVIDYHPREQCCNQCACLAGASC